MPQAEKDLAALDQVFKALAHPARRQILLILQFRGGAMTAGQIAKRFAHSWPTTTRHLQRLRDAGLIALTVEGRERIYRVNTAELERLEHDFLRWFRDR